MAIKMISPEISEVAHGSCYFWLKSTAITLTVVILYVSTLDGTNRQTLPPKKLR